MAKATRAQNTTWLVGFRKSDISNLNQLPTIKDALARIYFSLIDKKQKLYESLHETVEEIFEVWAKANILTILRKSAFDRLKRVHTKYTLMLKNKSKKSVKQQKNIHDYELEIKTLFDISQPNVLEKLNILEDIDFLKDQRNKRKMFIAEVDQEFARKVEKKKINKEKVEKRKKKMEEEMKIYNRANVSFVNVETNDLGKSDPDYQGTCSNKKKTRNIKSAILDDEFFTAALDRANVSSRQAMHIVAPALKAIGVNIEDITLSTSSIRRSRISNRSGMAEDIKRNFNPGVPLILHFDGKILPDSNIGLNSSDRLAVLLSGKNVEKLIGVPKVQKGTGAQISAKSVDLAEEWGVVEHICGVSFDTTSSNTGIHSGACFLIEKRLDRKLLFFACRHHVFEIISTAVFDKFFISKGPEIDIFNRLKKKWEWVDKTSYKILDLTDYEKNFMNENCADLKNFIVNQLTYTLHRDDYREFLELALICLGSTPPRGVKFVPPGACHRARWMAKGIYLFKLYIFQDQLQLTSIEKKNIRKLIVFTIFIYLKCWFQAHNATDAPINDLILLKNLEKYQQIDNDVSQLALMKLKNHLWYLSEYLAPLAFFSDHLALEVKAAMVSALEIKERSKDVKRRESKSIVQAFSNLEINNFITKRSLQFFDIAKLKMNFLLVPPAEWEKNESYLYSKYIVSSFRVVNDCAERAIKLATDFNLTITKDEEQKQYLLQVVEAHRKLILEPSKSHFLNK